MRLETFEEAFPANVVPRNPRAVYVQPLYSSASGMIGATAFRGEEGEPRDTYKPVVDGSIPSPPTYKPSTGG